MRFLLIDDDAELEERLRRRLVAWLSDGLPGHEAGHELVVRNPILEGFVASEFLAQGFDAVLLGHECSGGSGLIWARELGRREGFAPVVLVSATADDADTQAVIADGVYLLSREEVSEDKLYQVLSAAGQKQAVARELWRTSTTSREAQLFGGTFVRGYRHIRRLAAGTVSDLYLGESEQAGSLVALKIARDRHREQSDLDDSFRRFLQEYEIVQRIHHPSVVKLYDLGVSDEHAWLVMEYFRQGDLRRRMKSGVTPRRALRTVILVAHALQAVHEADVLHRDVKPGNVMLRDDGSIALIDFGMSKDAALAQNITDQGMIFGTPHYMSPEQGHGEPIDARSDLYSLGVILFEMLAREKPFKAENPMAIIYKHRKEPVPPLPEPLAWLQPVVERFLAKQPDERYASAAEAALVLQTALEQLNSREVLA